jgi:hypothetical protein
LWAILLKKPGLVERKRAIFYRGTTAFLHFHEDPAGMFADLRSGADFERYAVNTKAEIARLLRAAKAQASAPGADREATLVRNVSPYLRIARLPFRPRLYQSPGI